MSATLPKKVAFQREHTGVAGDDRMQRLAQKTAAAHEQTKAYVTTQAASLAALTTQARRGVLRLVGAGATNIVLSDAQNAYPVIDITGTLTAGINLTVAACTDELARVVFVNNATTGGFAVSVISAGGGGGTGIAAGVKKPLLVSAAGVTALT